MKIEKFLSVLLSVFMVTAGIPYSSGYADLSAPDAGGAPVNNLGQNSGTPEKPLAEEAQQEKEEEKPADAGSDPFSNEFLMSGGVNLSQSQPVQTYTDTVSQAESKVPPVTQPAVNDTLQYGEINSSAGGMVQTTESVKNERDIQKISLANSEESEKEPQSFVSGSELERSIQATAEGFLNVQADSLDVLPAVDSVSSLSSADSEGELISDETADEAYSFTSEEKSALKYIDFLANYDGSELTPEIFKDNPEFAQVLLALTLVMLNGGGDVPESYGPQLKKMIENGYDPNQIAVQLMQVLDKGVWDTIRKKAAKFNLTELGIDIHSDDFKTFSALAQKIREKHDQMVKDYADGKIKQEKIDAAETQLAVFVSILYRAMASPKGDQAVPSFKTKDGKTFCANCAGANRIVTVLFASFGMADQYFLVHGFADTGKGEAEAHEWGYLKLTAQDAKAEEKDTRIINIDMGLQKLAGGLKLSALTGPGKVAIPRGNPILYVRAKTVILSKIPAYKYEGLVTAVKIAEDAMIKANELMTKAKDLDDPKAKNAKVIEAVKELAKALAYLKLVEKAYPGQTRSEFLSTLWLGKMVNPLGQNVDKISDAIKFLEKTISTVNEKLPKDQKIEIPETSGVKIALGVKSPDTETSLTAVSLEPISANLTQVLADSFPDVQNSSMIFVNAVSIETNTGEELAASDLPAGSDSVSENEPN